MVAQEQGTCGDLDGPIRLLLRDVLSLLNGPVQLAKVLRRLVSMPSAPALW